MSIPAVVFVTVLACALWTGIWNVLYSETEKEWMYILACGPFVWLCFFIVGVICQIKKIYYRYYYKAVVENENGDKYWCNTKDMKKICEQYDTKPAYEFAAEAKFKPYKNYKNNPRFVHRDIACKLPEISLIKEKKDYVWKKK